MRSILISVTLSWVSFCRKSIKLHYFMSFLKSNSFRTYQIASMVISPIVGMKMDRIGRKNCIIIGFIFIVSATLGFGLLANVEDE